MNKLFVCEKMALNLPILSKFSHKRTLLFFPKYLKCDFWLKVFLDIIFFKFSNWILDIWLLWCLWIDGLVCGLMIGVNFVRLRRVKSYLHNFQCLHFDIHIFDDTKLFFELDYTWPRSDTSVRENINHAWS